MNVAFEPRRTTGLAPWSEALLNARGVFAVFSLYCLAHFVLRLLLGPGLGPDNAEQALFAQDLSLLYSNLKQPPLYTWMTWLVFQLTGPGLVGLGIVRFALLWVGYLALFAFGRRVTGNEALAALAAYSYLLLYVFAHFALRNHTHTLLLSTLVALGLLFWARAVQEGGRWWDFAALGLVIGLGPLAKYNAIYLPAALLAASALVPELRRRAFGAGLWISAGAAALVALPFGALLWFGEVPVTAIVLGKMHAHPDAAGLLPRLTGLGLLALEALKFLMPMLAILALALPQCLHRRGAGAPDPSGLRRALGWQIVAGLGLLVATVLITAPSHLKYSWFHPVLLGVPVLLFARLLGRTVSRRRLHAFLLAVFAVTALVALERALNPYLWPEHCPKCRRFVPYPELAEQLRARGVPEDITIIARDDNVAGNLAVQFPRAVTLSTDITLFYQPRPRPGRSCLIAWGDHRAAVETQVPDEVRQRLEAETDARLGPGRRDGVVTAGLVGAPRRPYHLAYIHAPPGDPRCPRRVLRP